jgi:hypothetical protein
MEVFLLLSAEMHLQEHYARLEELSEGLGIGFDEDVHRALE